MDASKYLRLLLLSDSAVSALVSGRCFEAPVAEGAEFPCIGFDLPPAPSAGQAVEIRTATVTCWGPTMVVAKAVRDALRTALFGGERNWWRATDGTVVFGIRETTLPSRGVDGPDRAEFQAFGMEFGI